MERVRSAVRTRTGGSSSQNCNIQQQQQVVIADEHQSATIDSRSHIRPSLSDDSKEKESLLEMENGNGHAATAAAVELSNGNGHPRKPAVPPPITASTGGGGGISRMGLFVLVLLAVQNCSKNLVVRYVMQNQPKFLTSAAVLSSECIKLSCSVAYILFVQGQSLASIVRYLRQNARHTMLLVVPASAYNLQMSLEYVALANLNAAMFSVLVQTKLLCTALFAALVLRKKLKYQQILSLVLLTTGVMLCNMRTTDSSNSANDDDAKEEESGRQTKGILATLGIALSSGFASVYTEKFIKGAQKQQQQQSKEEVAKDKLVVVEPEQEVLCGKAEDENTTTSTASSSSPVVVPQAYGLAYTQVQLAVMSILTIGLYALMMDWRVIISDGLFYNFSQGAVVSVCMSALGGLIVASVLKYADSILKGYATALSVILTGILSMMLFGTNLSAIYFMGIINVVTAVILYNGKDLHQYVCS